MKTFCTPPASTFSLGRIGHGYSRRACRLLFLVVVLWMSACSGSLSLSIGNAPPTVSLALAPLTLNTPGNISLSAAAVDDDGIREVLFYRLLDNTPLQLAQLTTAPYQITVPLSKVDNGSVRFFARAIDNEGDSADSDIITMTVAIP